MQLRNDLTLLRWTHVTVANAVRSGQQQVGTQEAHQLDSRQMLEVPTAHLFLGTAVSCLAVMQPCRR